MDLFSREIHHTDSRQELRVVVAVHRLKGASRAHERAHDVVAVVDNGAGGGDGGEELHKVVLVGLIGKDHQRQRLVAIGVEVRGEGEGAGVHKNLHHPGTPDKHAARKVNSTRRGQGDGTSA
eukprot:6175424-Pleurochrysis_carterae.AAC.1